MPIDDVFTTCVPPQNSREMSGSMVTTRTCEPYLSPKNIFTFGIIRASSYGITSVSTAIPSLIFALTIPSMSASSAASRRLKWLKSKRR